MTADRNKPLKPQVHTFNMLLLKIELKKIEPISLISLPEKSRNNTQ